MQDNGKHDEKLNRKDLAIVDRELFTLHFGLISDLYAQRDKINAAISAGFKGAQDDHIVPKILRKVIKDSRADPDQLAEEDQLLAQYTAALDDNTLLALELAREGKTVREIEAATGISKSTVDRIVPTNKNGWDKAQRPEIVVQPDASALCDADDAASRALLDHRPEAVPTIA